MKRLFQPSFDVLEVRRPLAINWAQWVNFGVAAGDQDTVLPGSELNIAISMPGDPTLTGIANVTAILSKGSLISDYRYMPPNTTLYPDFETKGFHNGETANLAVPVNHVDDGSNPKREVQQYVLKGINAPREDGTYTAFVRADFWKKTISFVNGIPVTSWSIKPILYPLTYKVLGPTVASWRIANFNSAINMRPIPAFRMVYEKGGVIVPSGGDEMAFMFFEPGVGQTAIGGYGWVKNSGPNGATLGVVQVITSFVEHLKWADGKTTDIKFTGALDSRLGGNTYLYSFKGSGIQVLSPNATQNVRLASPGVGSNGYPYPFLFYDSPSLTVPLSLAAHGTLQEVSYRANFESNLVIIPTGQAPVVSLASVHWWIGGSAARIGQTYVAVVGAGAGSQDMTKTVPPGQSTVIEADAGIDKVPTRSYPRWKGSGESYIYGLYNITPTAPPDATGSLGVGTNVDLAVSQAIAEIQSDQIPIRRSKARLANA